MAASLSAAAAVLVVNFFAAILVISLNKRVFSVFPFPATLTSIHYFVAWAGVAILNAAGTFERRAVPPDQTNSFYSLIVCWSLCNALSNISLERNSVGFYQLAKLLVMPSLVVFDRFFYDRRVTVLQGGALFVACAGVALASIEDVQFHTLGAVVAVAAVTTAAAQKVINSHVQQIGGLSSLQVMHNAFPAMAFLSLAYIPILDRNVQRLLSLDWVSVDSLIRILLSAIAAFSATWSATAIFGMISALAHVLLGQVKTCSVLLVAFFFYDAQPTPMGVVGASLALSAITAYSLLKLKQPGHAVIVHDRLSPMVDAAGDTGEEDDEENPLNRNE